ncbi:MAG: hypothetical protein ABIP53_11085 [Candidatus Limnocylindrales bacterium]
MKTFRLVVLVAVLLMLTVFSGSAIASSINGNNGRNIVLIFNGPSVANSHAAPNTPTFASWCNLNGPCSPSVMQPVYDASTGQLKGSIYVWTKNFVYSADGQSLCFGEYIWFALADGDVYTHSGSNGTCGGFIDPALKPVTHITGFGKVVAGGGDGTIVDGSGRFKKWTGTYTDRVFVEFNFSQPGANYYDELFFSISRTGL